MKHLMTYNESVRSLMKPISNDELKKVLDQKDISNRLSLIKSKNLNILDLYSTEEIRNMFDGFSVNHKLNILKTMDLFGKIYSDEEELNMLNQIEDLDIKFFYVSKTPNQKLYTKNELKNLISKLQPEEKIRKMILCNIVDIYTDIEIRGIMWHMEPIQKLSFISSLNRFGRTPFSKDEIKFLFGELGNADKSIIMNAFTENIS